MKTYTTNYFDHFIEVAPDTKRTQGTKPPSRGDQRTIAEMQYEMIAKNPYGYTSDEVLFQVFADRSGLVPEEYGPARERFFSKGQACLRASPLTKSYGFGIHSDSRGKIALYGMETPQYQKFLEDPKLKKEKAMKSSRK
jgi:hypothetical protein